MKNSSWDLIENGNKSPLDPIILNSFAMYLAFTAIMCLLSNTFLIATFWRYQELRTPLNILIGAIALCNLLSTFQFPLVITSNLNQRWSFSKLSCHLSGFLMYFTGCMHTFLMAAISFERYYSIYNPKQANKITFKLMLKLVMACFLASLFWSTMPLLGWSNYMLEDGATGCCIETREKSLNVQSYNLAMFVFVFMIPFGFIIVLNICFFLTIKNDETKQEIPIEQREITFIILTYIGGFVITWTPFAIVTLYGALIDPDYFSPLASTLPAIFCKSSTVWPTLFYIYLHRNIKSKLSLNGWLKIKGD